MVHPYNIYFSIVEGAVMVLRVMHGARDQNRVLFGEN
jgi:plasmid stabilization system protein ParE